MGLCQQYATAWPPSEQDTAQAVCTAESSGNPGAIGDNGDSIGLWQVDTRYHPEYPKSALMDPAYNAQAALAIWQGSGWRAWSTYNDGLYLAFLNGAPISSDSSASPSQPAAPSAGLLLVAAVAAFLLLN